MAVTLQPPITGCPHRPGEPLLRGPRYVRKRTMSRWHRVRSGILLPVCAWRPEPTPSWSLWCGQSTQGTDLLGRDRAPVDGPVCGPCEGRALGADPSQERLIFTPRWLNPPAVCPGSGASGARRGLWIDTDSRLRVGLCLVCGVHERIRAVGGRYYSEAGLTGHRPGPGLIEPCVFHRWQYVARIGDRAACGICERTS